MLVVEIGKAPKREKKREILGYDARVFKSYLIGNYLMLIILNKDTQIKNLGLINIWYISSMDTPKIWSIWVS